MSDPSTIQTILTELANPVDAAKLKLSSDAGTKAEAVISSPVLLKTMSDRDVQQMGVDLWNRLAHDTNPSQHSNVSNLNGYLNAVQHERPELAQGVYNAIGHELEQFLDKPPGQNAGVPSMNYIDLVAKNPGFAKNVDHAQIYEIAHKLIDRGDFGSSFGVFVNGVKNLRNDDLNKALTPVMQEAGQKALTEKAGMVFDPKSIMADAAKGVPAWEKVMPPDVQTMIAKDIASAAAASPLPNLGMNIPTLK